LNAENIGDFRFYLLPNQIVEIEFFDGQPVGINPPSSVELEVTEKQPTLRGATASASYKPAKLENGVMIQVPPFVQVGDRIRVGTADGKYLERVT
jgi:elongation factor P